MSTHSHFIIKYSDIPRVSVTDIASVKPPYVHFERKSEEYILYYILYGEMYLQEDGIDYYLQKNDFILLDPGKTHKGIKTSECEFFYIHFSLYNDERYQEIREESILPHIIDAKTKAQLVMPKYFHVESTEGLVLCHEKIEKIKTAFLGHSFYKEQRVSTYLYELLIILASEYAKGVYHSKIDIGGKVKPVIQELLEYLQKFYAEDITGDMLQEQFHYNFDYLNRQFKKWTGQTIFSYLNRLRIERANQLLLTGFYTISEVAALTGFRDIYYFSRVFQKITGNTPGEVRV